MKKLISFLCLVAIQIAVIFHVSAQSSAKAVNGDAQIDLSGNWSFQIDSLDQGVKQQWYNRKLKEEIKLPGSMTTNGKGDDITVNTPWTGSIEDSTWFRDPQFAKYRVPGQVKVPFWLQPDKYYKGAAWYQKTVNIPASWQNKHVELYIERSHWETTVWVDGKPAGMQNSLATAHVFDISGLLKTGRHQITVRVDNRVKDFNVGQNSHSISDHTQSNWNGMVGRLLLSAKPSISISDVQLYPDIKAKQVVARISVNNMTGKAANVSFKLLASTDRPDAEKLKEVSVTRLVEKNATVEIAYPMGNQPLLWSEFTPDTYSMQVNISSKQTAADRQEVTFGMREFSTNGTQFSINGQPTFLRGSLECAEFPKTGYPPTDLDSWMRIFKICKSYGLNHLRFHSWCPPDAAFEAADRMGFYLHIECSSWANQGATIGDGKPLDKYIYEESRRIVKAYGNHPSFCMMDYGNEPAGKNMVKYLTDFVTYWKKRDPRRLYTTGSGWPIVDEANYNSTPLPRIQQWGQGLKSIINGEAPRSDYDWADIIKKWQHPTVSHEIGQWCVYPDFKEISQYDGVLKAKNFEIFKDQLEENGMGSLAEDFLQASGKLQVLCYKADIEAALRTPGFGGFQLLGLYDFPGQGTALVGVLNPFWRDKGYVTGKEYSEFCNSVVPLVRLPKMVYLNNEHLIAPVEIAQFGASVLNDVVPAWDIRNENGDVLFQGKLDKTNIKFGNGIKLGEINVALSTIERPSRLSITVHVADHQNSWDIFVYPAALPATDQQIVVTQTLNEKAVETLANGGKVLLTLKKGSLKADKGGDIAIGFSSIFWNTAWTKQQPPVTLGILCDPKNPALKEFPTQAYSNWQWWDGMAHSNAIKLDAVSKDIKPIVRVIDDWVTARPLGLVFECKVGKGKLIVSGIDLLSGEEKRPEARQLLYSLKSYMNTEAFAPKEDINIEKITSLYN
ncbi:glycoside hydrolase family 2 TIM barrel-domain containing protein [Mucilaginibacter sabulilitoris]|uniref:beta-galactosidase n=1 Tax=Mucilaginibacter sabulilitoris TaxID=1173583 RepID=A0ABZ0TKH6_9SPHI|nr:sugar-binding domain-containing protein [Mucilaginibacter sabulilitoris]WPU93201.1 glycoside hydrolase family 2 TIM barrel-domain containing protein [Mucilaginibacter sabulilitoris]